MMMTCTPATDTNLIISFVIVYLPLRTIILTCRRVHGDNPFVVIACLKCCGPFYLFVYNYINNVSDYFGG